MESILITARAVLNPEIPEALHLPTGVHQSLVDVVGSDYDRAEQLRMAVKEGQQQCKPLYVCSECGVPVNLLVHPKSRRFYFKHVLEDGRCSAITRGQLTQEEINARKYNGAKESWRHLRMKELVAASLRADSRFSDIKVEGRWKDQLTGNSRQPDVQAIYGGPEGYGGVRVAFEIQLSTTYLDVIAARRLFYLKNGGLLFWVFAEFNDTGRRLTQDDVFFNNNQNAFLVTEETAATSVSLGAFHLGCAWAEPTSLTTNSALQRQTVSFHDLTLDTAKQQAFYYDFYGRRDSMQRVAAEKKVAELGPLREDFETFWLARGPQRLEDDGTWKKLRGRFRQVGIELPEYASHLPVALFDVLYSVKHGRPIGWAYSKLVELAHWVVAQYPHYLQLFRKALFVYGRGEQLETEDRTGKWREKAMKYKKAIKAGDPTYTPDTSHDRLVAFFFPELVDEAGGLL